MRNIIEPAVLTFLAAVVLVLGIVTQAGLPVIVCSALLTACGIASIIMNVVTAKKLEKIAIEEAAKATAKKPAKKTKKTE